MSFSLFSAQEIKYGYIQPKGLKELWVHTGTQCNLHCPFCFEGAGPTSNRIESITLSEAIPYMQEAIELGVQHFSFTGGEPFMNRDFVAILDFALDHKPCLVLTNATAPLQKYYEELALLSQKKHALSFRISLDAPYESAHDENRGKGMFARALESMQQLDMLEFKFSVARHKKPNEDSLAVEMAYRELFRASHLPDDIRLVAFADLSTPNNLEQIPTITENCMTQYKTEAQRDSFMCCHSAMIAKQEGSIQVYPCTLVNDSYDFSHSSLKDALSNKVYLQHHRCYTCFCEGTSCSEL